MVPKRQRLAPDLVSVRESKGFCHSLSLSRLFDLVAMRRTGIDEDDDLPIEENLNRLQINQHSARNIEHAIDIFQ